MRKNLPTNVQDPLVLTRRMMKNRKCNFSLQSVHPDAIKKIISNLKPSKSCGLDNIDTYVIKLAADELIPVEDSKSYSPSQEGQNNLSQELQTSEFALYIFENSRKSCIQSSCRLLGK